MRLLPGWMHMQTCWGAGECSYLNMGGGGVTQVFTEVKINWTLHLRFVHFRVCKFYLTNKIEK